MQNDDRLPLHGRQLPILLDPFQRREAFFVRARGVAEVSTVEQAAGFIEDIPLNAPLVEVKLVGPELFSPQGGHRQWIVHGGFLADRAARESGKFGRKDQTDAEDAANHGPVP